MEKSDVWYLACNVRGDSIFRDGAKCHVVFFNDGNANDRMKLGGLSRGGRYIEKFVSYTKISNLRPSFSPKVRSDNYTFFATKELAQDRAKRIIERHLQKEKANENN